MSNKKLDIQILIGERLRTFRKEKGLKSTEMASNCMISQGSYSGLENGKSAPSAETIANLIKNTDIDINWLLTGEKKEEKIVIPELNIISEWLSELIKKEPYRKDWFQGTFEDAFPMFKQWKERKEEEIQGVSRGQGRKIA